MATKQPGEKPQRFLKASPKMGMVPRKKAAKIPAAEQVRVKVRTVSFDELLPDGSSLVVEYKHKKYRLITRRKSSPAKTTIMTDSRLSELGRAMSAKFMPEIAIAHPEDKVVLFLVELGTYLTAKNDTELLDKYDALHKDAWGWVTDIVRGPRGADEGMGRP